MKSVNPDVRVVGGTSAGLTSAYTREFITKGGLKGCDVIDLHIYDAARPAETYEEPFRALEELMKAHGDRRPIWITEWGCYADDDPPNMPQRLGDATMNRCRWPTERAATEHIVKFAAVGFAHGLRKIFFHAGTAGRINGPDAGGVLFEFGGTPRTMYAGIAAFTRMFNRVSSPLQIVDRHGLHGYVFSTIDLDLRDPHHSVVAVAWSSSEKPSRLTIDPAATAVDLMGNTIGERTIELRRRRSTWWPTSRNPCSGRSPESVGHLSIGIGLVARCRPYAVIVLQPRGVPARIARGYMAKRRGRRLRGRGERTELLLAGGTRRWG